MARLLKSHGVVMQGIGTPLSLAAMSVAKATHAPDTQVVFTTGNVLSDRFLPIRLCSIEWSTMPGALARIRIPELVWQIAPNLTPAEFIRPAQIDPFGNTNTVVIGSYKAPIVRLPGAAGIPEAQCLNPGVYFYVPRHNPRTLVPQVHFRTGGVPARRRKESSMSYLVITDRAVIRLENGRAELTSIHLGETREDVEALTGFPLEGSPGLTEPPSTEEMTALREFDPLRTRDLELMDGVERRSRLRRLIAEESRMFVRPGVWRRKTGWELVDGTEEEKSGS